jgi:hypothetical protein
LLVDVARIHLGAGEKLVVNRIMITNYSISETFDVGVDMGSSVSKGYDRDNEFSGELKKVVVHLRG